MAIGIKVKKAEGAHDLSASKFFGTPTVPLAWEDDFCEDEIFLCQIRMSDIAPLDEENALPHKGYLYVFLDVSEGDYHLRPIIRYSENEPQLAFDEFNADIEGYGHLTEDWLMEFFPAEEDYDGMRLLGVPSDWNYEEDPPKLFLQYDPLEAPMGFLEQIDGYVYVFFDDDLDFFTDTSLWEEYS